MALTMHPSLAVHPGDWLKSEIVDPHGVSINRLAACFHVTRQTLSNLFNGHTALSVAKANNHTAIAALLEARLAELAAPAPAPSTGSGSGSGSGSV